MIWSAMKGQTLAKISCSVTSSGATDSSQKQADPVAGSTSSPDQSLSSQARRRQRGREVAYVAHHGIALGPWQMRQVQTKLGDNGRVVIPAEFRRSMGLKAGDPLVIRLDEDGLRIESRRAAVRAAQRMVRERVPKDELLTERLFRMRRAETRDE